MILLLGYLGEVTTNEVLEMVVELCKVDDSTLLFFKDDEISFE